MLASLATYAQNPTPIDQLSHRFILLQKDSYSPSSEKLFRLDTSCGELAVLNFTEKAIYVVLEGCPTIPQQERYDGRFGIINFKHCNTYYLIMIDHKLGDMWRLTTDGLIPIPKSDKPKYLYF